MTALITPIIAMTQRTLELIKAMYAGGCCEHKVVGGVYYYLVQEDKEWTEAYGCKDGCVYRR
jgi:hypothetical protein